MAAPAMITGSICRRCYPFAAPVSIICLCLLLSYRWQEWTALISFKNELKAVGTLFPYFPYLLLGLGTLLGWRFQKTGVMLAAWLLGLTYWLYHHLPMAVSSGRFKMGLHEIGVCLILLELSFLSLWRWRRLPAKWKITWLGLFFFQTVLLTYVISPDTIPWISNLIAQIPVSMPKDIGRWVDTHALAGQKRLYFQIWGAFSPSTLILLVVGPPLAIRTYFQRDALLAGFGGCLLTLWLSIGSTHSPLSQTTSFAAAGLILIVSLIEASFSMAYHDELTGLPGRRSLNETLSSLGRRYTIAMMDVDRFKKFNDTYGHKTGDEVLKMIATHLQKMSGGAKAFRYGGEEFTAIFSGKTVSETVTHLDAYRKKLAGTPFIVRNKARKKSSASHRKKTGNRSDRQVYVTVSIGAAEPNKRLKTPHQVIKAADAALYRAKRSGRNCIKT